MYLLTLWVNVIYHGNIAEACLESRLKLTPLQRRFLSYRNQSTDLQRKSMHWFLYDRDLRHERVTSLLSLTLFTKKLHYKMFNWVLNMPLHELENSCLFFASYG